MARITQYPEETSPSANDVVLIDGVNGSRKVKFSTLIESLMYKKMRINSQTKYSDISGLVESSLNSGKIPHVTVGVATNPGASIWYKDLCLWYSNTWLYNNSIVFKMDLDGTIVTITVEENGLSYGNITNMTEVFLCY